MTDHEIPSAAEMLQDGAEETTPVRYRIGGEENAREVTLEELLLLAEKGLDYDRMKETLNRMEAESRRREQEAAELAALFPEADPDEVMADPIAADYIAKGYSLAAAQAMRLAEREKIRRIEQEAARRSTGDMGAAGSRGEYYSDEQLAAMSIGEIKKRLPQIMKRFQKNI